MQWRRQPCTVAGPWIGSDCAYGLGVEQAKGCRRGELCVVWAVSRIVKCSRWATCRRGRRGGISSARADAGSGDGGGGGQDQGRSRIFQRSTRGTCQRSSLIRATRGGNGEARGAESDCKRWQRSAEPKTIFARAKLGVVIHAGRIAKDRRCYFCGLVSVIESCRRFLSQLWGTRIEREGRHRLLV